MKGSKTKYLRLEVENEKCYSLGICGEIKNKPSKLSKLSSACLCVGPYSDAVGFTLLPKKLLPCKLVTAEL